MDSCYLLSQEKPFKGENLESLSETVYEQRHRPDRLFEPAGSAV
ncbi:hypothetical protein [Cyclonatronum proteinivorum]|nr:hypothetical protein [Cyclonatronum proteinivorum]